MFYIHSQHCSGALLINACFSYTLEDENIILLQFPETPKKNLVPSAGPSVPVAMTTPTVPTTPGPNGMSYIHMYTCICPKYRFSLVPLH